jgi:hypothetical protein
MKFIARKTLLAPYIDVLLDGAPLAYCFEADTAEGYALCYATDANGNLMRTDDGQNIATTRLEGAVSIRLKIDEP